MPLSPPLASRTRKPTGKTLIFHIGDHKTGSTSIQTAFAAGKVRLKGRKLLYPGNLNHNYLREHMASLAKGDTEKPGRKGMPSLTGLAKAIAASEADFILLSGESFEGVDPVAFHDLLTRYFGELVDEVRIVAYIRPHAPRLLSTYTEQSKIGWYDGTPGSYFRKTKDSKRFFYAPRLQAWKDRFGDSYILRPMIRESLKSGSILEDFVNSAFGDLAYDIAEIPPSNESLGLEDLVMLRHLHRHMRKAGKGARLGFGWDIARIAGQIPREPAPTRLQLHRSLAQKIRETYRADAQQLDAEFFGGGAQFEQALDAAVETALPEAQSLEPTDHFSPGELRNLSVIAETLGAMLAQKNVNWPAMFRKRRVEAMREAPQ